MITRRIACFLALAGAIYAAAFSVSAKANTIEFNPQTYTVPENAGSVTVTLVRDGDIHQPATVNYATANGTAIAGQDYDAVSGKLTFGPDVASQTITIPIANDLMAEDLEKFTISLSSPSGGTLGQAATATISIADDDDIGSTIAFDSASYTVNEGDGFAKLVVVRSGGLAAPASVTYSTSDGTTTAGSDYAASSGTLTFNPGEVRKTIMIPLIDDATPESSETFTVDLGVTSSNAQLGSPDSSMVTIVDNDGVGNTVQFSPTSYAAQEMPGTSTVQLTVTATRLGDPNKVITVHYQTRDGSAKLASGDYAASNGTIFFGPGETQKTISVTVLDDSLIENAEDFFLDLSNATNAQINPSGQTATVTIADDDSGTSTIQFSSATFSVGEGDGAVNLTVVRSGGLGFAVSARYDTVDQSAKAGSDYTGASGTVTFAPGQFSKTISLPILQDTLVEPTETFTVILSNPSVNATIRSPSTTTVSIEDDDPADNTTKLANISTRGPVESGNDVMIAGFIIQGSSFKQLVIRGLGPSLTSFGVPDAINDPTLTLQDANGTQLAFNDNYGTNSDSDKAVLSANGLTPPDTREAAIVFTATPAAYTAILRGKNNGVGLVEVYDVNQTEHARLVNISTRAKVEAGDNGAIIAGFIVTAPAGEAGTDQTLAIRAIGPSLAGFGISNTLADPTLDLYFGSQLILSNDNWKTNSTQDRGTLQANGLAPANDKEAALVTTLSPGSYSAVVRGKGNTTGVALVEVYHLEP